jgi:hypothetical protein
MMFRAFAAFLLAAVPFAARASDEVNPYKNAKVGDFAKYAVKGKLGFLPLDGVVTQTVAAKSDAEATLKIVLTAGGVETPFPDQKIDLTKPLDPTKGFALPKFGSVKLEKLKDGKEKVKVGTKEYEAEWSTYKLKVTHKGVESEGDLKMWVSQEVPTRMVKMNLAITVDKNDVKLAAELTEFGSAR